MSRRSVMIRAIGYVMALIYGVGLTAYLGAYAASFSDATLASRCPVLFSSGFSSMEAFQAHAMILSVLLALQLVALFGVIILKEWGRRYVVILSVATCVYVLARMLFVERFFDPLSVAIALVYAGVASFFHWDEIQEQFTGTKERAGKTVLFIDDDRVFLRMAKGTMSKKGLRVLTASNGEQGLAVAKRKVPDLIVLDVLMPGIKGREVCARLKQEERTKDIPVIFLTAKDSPDDVKAEIEMGAVGHLTKPLDPRSLLIEVRKILHI